MWPRKKSGLGLENLGWLLYELSWAALPVNAVSDYAREGHIAEVVDKRGAAGALVSRDDAFSLEILRVNTRTQYLIEMDIGTPPQHLFMVLSLAFNESYVPSRSACTTCGSEMHFNETESSTFHSFDEDFTFLDLSSGKPVVMGPYIADNLSFSGTKIENVTLGMISVPGSSNGIIGIGPGSSFLDMLVDKGRIESQGFSLFPVPYAPRPDGRGEGVNWTLNALFGAVDTSKFEGEAWRMDFSHNISSENQLRLFVNLHEIRINNETLGTAKFPLQVDMGLTGRESILPESIVDEIWQRYQVKDENGIGVVPCTGYAPNATINLKFGGECGPSIPVAGSDMVPRGSAAGPPSDDPVGSCVFPIQKPGFQGLVNESSSTFILGTRMWKQAYLAFDMVNNEVMIAKGTPEGNGGEVVPFEKQGAKIPGVGKLDVGAKSPECTAVADDEGNNGEDGKESTASTTILSGGLWYMISLLMSIWFV